MFKNAKLLPKIKFKMSETCRFNVVIKPETIVEKHQEISQHIQETDLKMIPTKKFLSETQYQDHLEYIRVSDKYRWNKIYND